MSRTFAPPTTSWSAADLAWLAEQLGAVDGSADIAVSDKDLVEQITELEKVKTAAAGRQAVLTARLADAQLTAAIESTSTLSAYRRRQLRRSVAAQVARARRESPHRGNEHLTVAIALTTDMPHTLEAVLTGQLSEYRASLVVQETSLLSAEHRRQVDLELAGTLGTSGNKQVAVAAARIAYRLDANQAVKRRAHAESERRVMFRPAPDTMAYISALVTAERAAAARAVLEQRAGTAKALGDARGRGQLMADDLIGLLTAPARLPETPADLLRAAQTRPSSEAVGTDGGASTTVGNPLTDGHASNLGAAVPEGMDPPAPEETSPVEGAPENVGSGGPPGLPAGTGIEIHLVMTDRTLFDGDDEPAILTGYGALPAPLARRLIRESGETTMTWVRRLYVDPPTGNLTGMDSRRRLFTPAQRQFLISRDQTCRTPWCDATIRHTDHVTPFADTGRTTLADAQGLCESCNYLKQERGWESVTNADGTITVTTPTGQTHVSRPPPPPKSPPWPSDAPVDDVVLPGIVIEIYRPPRALDIDFAIMV